MLTTQKLRKSRRLAAKPRVDYTPFFTNRIPAVLDVSDTEQEMQKKGSINSLEAYDVSTSLKQINAVKKMRLKSGKPATLLPVRRSARLAGKEHQDVAEIADILLDMKISPVEIGANSTPLFSRPTFMEPPAMAGSMAQSAAADCAVQPAMAGSMAQSAAADCAVPPVDVTKMQTKSNSDYFASLLFGLSTTADLYGDIITIAEMIEAYPWLIEEVETRESLKIIGKTMSVRFLADEAALRSARCTSISNAISTLLAL